jgi:hypothetical protein
MCFSLHSIHLVGADEECRKPMAAVVGAGLSPANACRAHPSQMRMARSIEREPPLDAS